MTKSIYVATAITPGIYENVVKVMASSFAKHSTYKLHIYCLNFTNAQYENMKDNSGLTITVSILLRIRISTLTY